MGKGSKRIEEKDNRKRIVEKNEKRIEKNSGKRIVGKKRKRVSRAKGLRKLIAKRKIFVRQLVYLQSKSINSYEIVFRSGCVNHYVNRYFISRNFLQFKQLKQFKQFKQFKPINPA